MGSSRLPFAAPVALVVFTALGTGCGGAEPPCFVRLALTPSEGSSWEAEAAVVSRFEPAESPGQWSLRTEAIEPNEVLEQLEAEGRAVLLGGRGGRTRTVAILSERLDPTEFNLVQIHQVVEGQSSVKITLRGKGLEDWSSIFFPVEGNTEVRRTVIPVPRSVREGGLLRELRIVYAGGRRNIGLMAVEFLDQPVEGLVADPRGGHGPIRIGDEWREGVGLTPDHPLETTFDHVPQAELVFAVGELVETFAADREVSLKVTLEGRRREISEEIQIGGLGSAPGWRLHAIDLAALARGPVTARFEVSAGGDPNVACAIGEPALSRADPELPPEQPSVLLVTSDTHRGDHLGVAGDEEFISTPVFDRLAAEGVYFDQCFVQSNVTNPSHGCLLTGLDPTRTRISNNNQQMSASARTLAEAFRARGYATWAALGVRHLLGDVSGLGQGFDRMGGPLEAERPANETLDLALEWLSEKRRAPVFLWVHVYDPHWPYEPLAELEALYADEIDTTRPPFEWDHRLVSTRGDIENLDVPRARYKAEVSGLDRDLGRLLEHEFFSRGIVALVGDHGEALGEHEIYFTHAELYPDVLHVPLLLRWPDAPRGTRISGIVNQADLGRTLLDLAGLQDEGFPGRGLLRHIEAGSAGGDVHFALAGSDTCASITRDGMHLILHLSRHRSAYSVIRKEPHAVELYDLDEDPASRVNLVDERPQLAAELRTLLVRWLENADPEGLLGGEVNDPELERQLAELGYVDLGGSVAEPLWIADDCEWCARF